MNFSRSFGRSTFGCALVGVLLVFSMLPAFGYEKTELYEAVYDLEMQKAKLASLSSRSCAADYKAFSKNSVLKISMFYGYEDYEKATKDLLHAHAMIAALTAPCAREIAACGFQVVSQTASITRLQKKVKKQKVQISVYSTSFTNDNHTNTNPHSTYWDQERLSRQIKDHFYHDLIHSDVVFYAGHSRGGAGPGFDPQTKISLAVNAIFRRPLQPMLKALSQRPSRLKMLGLFSCLATKYYQREIESVNPGISLLLSKVDLEPAAGEQAAIGAINAILMKKCASDFKESLRAELEPEVDQFYWKP